MPHTLLNSFKDYFATQMCREHAIENRRFFQCKYAKSGIFSLESGKANEKDFQPENGTFDFYKVAFRRFR